MTNIATKNGSIIVKDGSLAENCDCCGGWYCCADLSCLANPSRVVVNVEADNYVAKYNMLDRLNTWVNDPTLGFVGGPPINPYKSTGCFFGQLIAGQTELTKTFSVPGRSEWIAHFTGHPAACDPVYIKVNLAYPRYFGYDDHIEVLFNPPTILYFHPNQTKDASDLMCGTVPYPDQFLGSPIEGSYSQQGEAAYSAPFSICADGSYTALVSNPFRPDNQIVEWSEDRATLDNLIARNGKAANSYRMLAANRRMFAAFTDPYITSVISRSGSNVVNIRVTIYP